MHGLLVTGCCWVAPVLQVTDLHRHFIDHLTIPSEKGKAPLRRVDEVFDCWFESGSMPYAQLHYPFENQAFFEANFPADFVAEGAAKLAGLLPPECRTQAGLPRHADSTFK